MLKFLVHHTFLMKPDEVLGWWNQAAPAFGEANKEGKFPAKCLYTWTPTNAEMHREAWCLWEANSSDEVRTTLRHSGILEYMAADVVEVGETSWMP